MLYNIEEHVHRYAVWTAARAVQRNFTTTGKIQEAIEVSGLPSFMDRLKQTEITSEQFDDAHREQARRLLKAFKSLGIQATFGLAAKIIAIYLKTAQVIRYPDSKWSSIIHPPIDRILLQGLPKTAELTAAGIRNKNWTQLEEKEYYQLIDALRKWIYPAPFWTIEDAWRPAG